MHQILSTIISGKKYKIDYKATVDIALKEDACLQDLTTRLLISKKIQAQAEVLSKDNIIVCGLDIFTYCFHRIDRSLRITALKKDGDRIMSGQPIARIKGKAASILQGERVALNFLKRLSGIATTTHKMVSLIERYGVILLDTRKTLPGLRALEKYAVFIGGGKNHRFNLKDEILIKENHIFALGGIDKALEKIKQFKKPFEVEVKDFKEFQLALENRVPIILLDNFKIRDIKKAVLLNKGKARLEVSGNVTLKNIKKMAQTGVDYISVGAVTHSAPSADFSLLIKGKNG
ncbi:MAG: carboxylating nicotinate-nucleotide diphosphorylase [Spirochaetes bacterium]|nr:carboxylating nicotinate-nucleotide diphosphorylase [Spirochaetota bacterium]